MRLISLSANHETFHTINFNPKGLSVVLGRKTTNDKGKTYNGVGKSLCVELIHFCLGSSKKVVFEEKIPGWIFTLRFSAKNTEHSLSRSTSRQDIFILDDVEYGAKALRKALMALVFKAPPMKFLTFRSLMPQFIRQGRAAYVSFDTLNKGETPYQKQLRAAFFLGLDVSLCEQKFRLKSELESLGKRQAALEDDDVIRDYLKAEIGAEAEIGLQDLREEIGRLSDDVAAFKVADNYYEIQQNADHTRRQLQEARAKSVQLKRAIDSIARSLELPTDVPTGAVEQVYKEASLALPDRIIRRLEDVSAFREKLLQQRRKRLSSERIRLQRELVENKKSIETLSAALDSKLQFLDSHGALGEFVDLTNHLADLKRKAARIQEIGELEKAYRKKIRSIDATLLMESAAAEDHLEELASEIRGHLERFRGYSRQFYPDKPGGLTISNNEGKNQIRFDIGAHIQDDASDGINEVKIYCYDMTILHANGVHSAEFIFHDSRLFGNIDPRQRAEIFRIALGIKNQYIATLNQDQLESMKPHLSAEEYQLLGNCVVEELTDADAAGKLLGVQVDMQYE